MSDAERLSMEELEAETGTRLPDKEVVSLLDLFVNADLALDLAAPVDLAVAANADAAIPISGAVSANVLSLGSTAQAGSIQDGAISQHLSGDAIATAPQDASIDQSNDVVDAGGSTGDTAAGTTGDLTSTVGDPVVGSTGDTTGTLGDTTGTLGDTTGTLGDTTGTVTDTGSGLVDGVTQSGVLDGNLLNVNVDVNLDADMSAPIAGAVAANANVAAPVSAAVGANIGSVASQAVAVSTQSVDISQTMDGVTAQATADQSADITQ